MNGALIVDIRTPKEYREKHALNAINIPIELVIQGKFDIPKKKLQRSNLLISNATSMLQSISF